MQGSGCPAATKWSSNMGVPGCDAHLSYPLQPGDERAVVLRYALILANDAPERNPRDWKLEGLLPEGVTPGVLKPPSCTFDTILIPWRRCFNFA